MMGTTQEKAKSGILRNAAALLDEMQLLVEAQGVKKVINSELWHACAGPLVSLPQLGDLVYYFPQGHSEQVAATTRKTPNSHIPNYPNLPSQLLCQVHKVTLHADKDTDEIYAQMTLQPVNSDTDVFPVPTLGYTKSKHPTEYFCKNLTASDTSTHGGFSVPRRAAEKLFPQLDYSMQPPNQELIVRDLHDNLWTFRHIYRGQPKRHLLTTGWSLFVGAKRLKAGDSVLFIRDEKSQLLLGVRRANRQQTSLSSSVLSTDSMHIGVLAAAAHAASSGSPFTIYYNPRTSPSAFVIPLARYNKATYIQASVGMRFAMMFETEESSKRRYTGTVVGINDYDPMRWPNSKWRNLQVEWDEHGYGERPERVSIWDIESPENSLVFPSPSLNSKRQCLTGYGVPGPEVGYANVSSFPKAQGNSYGNLHRMSNVGSEFVMMLLNQSGENITSPLNFHQSSRCSHVQSMKCSYIPQSYPTLSPYDTSTIKQEVTPPNETQQQLYASQSEKGDLQSCEVRAFTDSAGAPKLNDSRLELVNTRSYTDQSTADQNVRNEPRTNSRGSKKSVSNRTISEKSDSSSLPSQNQDKQHHGIETSMDQFHTERINHCNNEDSSGAVTRCNFLGDVSETQQIQCTRNTDAQLCQQLEHGLPSPKPESSKSPVGGKSVNSCLNQGILPRFFDCTDWMVQPSYYQGSDDILQFAGSNGREDAIPLSTSENILSSSADISSSVNAKTFDPSETFQASCLSDCFPNSIQEFICSPELNPLTFLSPEMHNLEVQQDGTILPSKSNSYVQMSLSEESGNPSENISSLHREASQRSINNSSCCQPLAIGGLDGGIYSTLPSLTESQVLSLQEIPNSSVGTSSCSMDATEYSFGRSAKQMKPPLRTYTKVQKLGSVGRSIDVTRFRDYHDLRAAIARMFGLQGKLEDPGSSDWKLVYVDYENDVLLVGDDPWEEFINCVRCIRILSSSEVQQMSENGVHILNDYVQTDQ